MARKVLAESIIIKNGIIVAMGCLTWYFLGYGLAYGQGGATSGVVGGSYFVLTGNPAHYDWFFRWGFASTAATIVSGAMSERTLLRSHVYWGMLMVSVVHPFVAHWIWSKDGWMSPHLSEDKLFLANGVLDFAGSGVVHLLGGIAGLIGAIVSGPRYGRFEDLYVRNKVFVPHDVGTMALGTCLLQFSWFGYNCGSTLRLNHSQSTVASLIVVNTTLAASTGSLVALLLVKLREGIWDLPVFLNGLLGGLVSITAGCAFVEPWAAFVIGSVSGIIYVITIKVMRHFKIDDVLDVVAVHASNGLWGLIAVGLFASKYQIYLVFNRYTYSGLFMGGGGMQLAAQIIGALVITAWGLFWSILFFYLLNYFGHLRIDKKNELRIFEETITNFKVKTTLRQMAHDYRLDNYIRNVEDDEPENQHQPEYPIRKQTAITSTSSSAVSKI
eukprot:TRINITY_DN7486_c0_g1_i1.p1 TRINITY_DN7486_c0_g1~~TRINITY_DN7486_c0_g1_i1.p1  ORF type:complete len:514 (-),score=75.63 TRINITY_DN7486_c0_g1_i1:62-1387(-)